MKPGWPSTSPASASAAMARPFQAATTLSSRPGRVRRPRAAASVARIPAKAARVRRVRPQLQDGRAVLEGARPE